MCFSWLSLFKQVTCIWVIVYLLLIQIWSVSLLLKWIELYFRIVWRMKVCGDVFLCNNPQAKDDEFLQDFNTWTKLLEMHLVWGSFWQMWMGCMALSWEYHRNVSSFPERKDKTYFQGFTTLELWLFSGPTRITALFSTNSSRLFILMFVRWICVPSLPSSGFSLSHVSISVLLSMFCPLHITSLAGSLCQVHNLLFSGTIQLFLPWNSVFWGYSENWGNNIWNINCLPVHTVLYPSRFLSTPNTVWKLQVTQFSVLCLQCSLRNIRQLLLVTSCQLASLTEVWHAVNSVFVRCDMGLWAEAKHFNHLF